ncbi:MAG: sigma-70 family RNA polymerase sigma factor [Cryomorphaceae bacterium]|nr:sigma-70 family RNA polymerase sigma factor [Cryomorphaceae bacterium]
MIIGKRISKLTDEELISRYRNRKENKVVGELFNRYALLVVAICRKYHSDDAEAEDAAMVVFESLFQLLLKHDVAAFKPWLMTVTRNQCLMALRKQKPNVHVNADAVDIAEDQNTDVDKEHLLSLLESALDALKPEQQLCLRLFYLEQKGYSEIAENTGMALKTVKSHLQNGKRNLLNTMKQP